MAILKDFKDTHLHLEGEKYTLGKNTVIEGDDAIIKEIISPVISEKGDVERICFSPFNEEIIEKIKAAFDCDYENKDDEYAVEIEPDKITVYSNSRRGYIYGACTIKAKYEDGIQGGLIYNTPLLPLRAVKMYLPAEDKLNEFYTMLEMFVHYGYNALILEIGGAMEYKRHPEINEYWARVCEDLFEYSGKTGDLQVSQPFEKNSIHIENGGGKWISQKIAKEISKFCSERELEIIPEVPSLSHADYLFAGRTDFAERPEDPFPDAYCPSNPKSYEVLFDVLDEVISVFDPKVVHIGHDELRTYGVCEKCRQKNPARIFADDVIKIYNYLKDKGIRTMMWGDKLLNAHKDNTWSAEGGAMLGVTFKKSDEKITFLGKEIQRTVRHGRITFWDDPKKLPEGIEYSIMKPLHPCIAMIPNDIIQVNWFYDFYSQSDEDYDTYGFPMVYGNFEGSAFKRWFDRANASAKGVVVSSWGASDYKQMQRGRRIFEAIYASRMVWNRNYDESKRVEEFDNTAAEIFKYRFGEALKGSYIDILHTVDLTVPHGYYGCGDFPSDDMFRLGHYHVYYKDGSDEKVEILWGENVGPMEIEENLASKLGNNAVQSYETAYYLETAFTNDWKVIDGKRYYRFVIPTKKTVDRVELELFDEYTEKFTLHSLDINN